MTLTATDRKRLRGMGQRMDDDARLGKQGLADGTVQFLRDLLARKELVKVRFTELEGEERRALAAETAAAVDAELVALVGRTILLYRANPDLPPSTRVLC